MTHNQSEIERAKAMAGMLGMCRVLSDTDDELSDVYSFGDASACYMNGYKLIEISKIITANYIPNSKLKAFIKESEKWNKRMHGRPDCKNCALQEQLAELTKDQL